MKTILFTLTFLAVTWAGAQQKNSLLEQSFWKNSPDVTTVQAEIAKGNNPSAMNSNAFDVTTIAINANAPTATLQFLLEQPGNHVNKLTHDNRIYLHWAASKGNIEIINYLISKGSNTTLEDSKGETPLTFAAVNGQTNPLVYEAFFKAGTNPKKKYKDGSNLLLMVIASDKDFSLSTYLATKGLSLQDTDNDGNTAFDYAAKTGDVAFLKTLHQKGVNHTNNALLFAAQGTRRASSPIACYRYLIEDLKINPTSTTASGETVLHFLAAKPNQKENISYFVSKGVAADALNNEGTNPLMISASGQDAAVTELFLSATKNINTQNTKLESALTFAVKSGTPEVVKMLIDNGADVSIVDKEGNNLGYFLIQSYRASGKGGRESEASTVSKQDPFDAKLQLLTEKGFNITQPQKDGNSLYHLAVIKNDITLLEKLAPLKIDVNTKNKDGFTALHKAALLAKDATILKYLVAMGAQKESKTEFDETAYLLAKENEALTKMNLNLEFLK
ncbi:MAG: ankyrin repeat domain-containing protein [Flavobacterium sp.]